MAENTPNPPLGGLPPKPAEAAKVQPKKETVRINLPPKPASSPTIKLPALPPTGAAPVAASAPVVAVASVSMPAASAAPAAKPAASAGSSASAPVARVATPVAAKPAAPAVPAMPARQVVRIAEASGLDQGLAIAAAVFGLAALGGVIYLMTIFNQAAAS